jgi:hypothetical protein
MPLFSFQVMELIKVTFFEDMAVLEKYRHVLFYAFMAIALW